MPVVIVKFRDDFARSLERRLDRSCTARQRMARSVMADGRFHVQKSLLFPASKGRRLIEYGIMGDNYRHFLPFPFILGVDQIIARYF